MPSVKLKAEIKRGKKIPAGKTLSGIPMEEAERLVKLGFAEYVDDPLSIGDTEDSDGDSGVGEPDIGKMKKSELVKRLQELDVELTGKENVAELREKFTAAMRDDKVE